MTAMTVDLSLPFCALLILAAGAVGYWTRGQEHRRQFTESDDVDRSTPELREFERRLKRHVP